MLLFLTFFRKLKANVFFTISGKQILKVLILLSNANWRNGLIYKYRDVL